MVTIETLGSLHQATQETHLQSLTSYNNLIPQIACSQPPVKTCFANCGQRVSDKTVVCTDSPWERNIALHNSTIGDRLGGHTSPKWVVKN